MPVRIRADCRRLFRLRGFAVIKITSWNYFTNNSRDAASSLFPSTRSAMREIFA
jgi:hypothetical protein